MENNKNLSVEDIKKTIRETIAELVEFDVNEITDDQYFVEEMGVNSITTVQVFLSCQEKYNVMLADDMNLAEPMSIQLLAEKIYRKINEE